MVDGGFHFPPSAFALLASPIPPTASTASTTSMTSTAPAQAMQSTPNHYVKAKWAEKDTIVSVRHSEVDIHEGWGLKEVVVEKLKKKDLHVNGVLKLRLSNAPPVYLDDEADLDDAWWGAWHGKTLHVEGLFARVVVHAPNGTYGTMEIPHVESVSRLKHLVMEEYSGKGTNTSFAPNHITVYRGGAGKPPQEKTVQVQRGTQLGDLDSVDVSSWYLAIIEDGTIGELSQRTAQLNLSGNSQASTSHGADASVSVPRARAVILMKQRAGYRVQNDATELPRDKETVSALKDHIVTKYSGAPNPDFKANGITVYACKDPKFANATTIWKLLTANVEETWKQFVNDKELDPVAQLESGHCYLAIIETPPAASSTRAWVVVHALNCTYGTMEIPHVESVSRLKDDVVNKYSGSPNPNFKANHITVYRGGAGKPPQEKTAQAQAQAQAQQGTQLGDSDSVDVSSWYLAIIDVPSQACPVASSSGEMQLLAAVRNLSHLQVDSVDSTSYAESYGRKSTLPFDLSEFAVGSTSLTFTLVNKNDEKELQKQFPQFMSCLLGTNLYDVIDTHARPLLGSKKPDVTLFMKGIPHNGITAVLCGEFKTSGTFHDTSSKGQALHYAELILNLQPLRHHAYTFLTDGTHIIFFKAMRVPGTSTATYYESAPLLLSPDGSRYLSSILSAPPECLGWISLPTVVIEDEDVEIVSFLGRGATSVVYEARWQANPCVLKIISSEHRDSFNMEKRIAALDWAKESKHIPDMIARGTLSGGEMFTLTTPVARPFGRSDLRVHHAISLVNVLEAAHTAGYVHRDVRPDNILLAESGVLLIDWGFAVSRGQDCPYRGTLCYASNRVLSHLENQGDEAFLVQPKDDLESLARSVCSLWDSNTGNELRQVPRNAGNLRHFWSSKQRIPKAWKTTNHTDLRDSFDIWFPG